jgi:hypothetical protein
VLINERKEKALAYVDKAIQRVDLHIKDAKNALSLKEFPPYVLASKIYQKEMKEGDFEKAAKVAQYPWSHEDCIVNYERLLRWNANFKKTQSVLASYQRIRSIDEKTKKEIVAHKESQEDVFFYSDVLALAQIGLTSEELQAFIDARGNMKVESGKDGKGKPYPLNLQGSNLIMGTAGSGKTLLLKSILHSLLNQNAQNEFSLVLVDIGAGHEMKEFETDPHLYQGKIIGDFDGLKHFMDEELPQEVKERKAKRKAELNDNFPLMLIAFNDFGIATNDLGFDKTKEWVHFLTQKTVRDNISSIFLANPIMGWAFQRSKVNMANVITMGPGLDIGVHFTPKVKEIVKTQYGQYAIIKN